MDLLHNALTEALKRNESDTEKWKKYKEDQIQSISNLDTFKNSLEIDIMVPVGTKALMPGKLYHTNEILVSHSPTLFSKCSARQAIQICKHRLEVAKQRIEALEKERDMYHNKLELPYMENAFHSDPHSEEIIEESTEEAERIWQEEHRKRVREHKQAEKLEREKSDKNDKKDVLQMLEELELMEELSDELDKLEINDDDTLEKILSGEIKQPVREKPRIAHKKIGKETYEDMSEKNTDINYNEYDSGNNVVVEQQDLTNNNQIANRSDYNDDTSDDENDFDLDDCPEEFVEKAMHASMLSPLEKLAFYKNHLQETHNFIKQMQYLPNYTYNGFVKKTDKIFLYHYLEYEIEKIQHYLDDNEIAADVIDEVLDTVMKKTTTSDKNTKDKEINHQQEANVEIVEKNKKGQVKRSVSFGNKDYIKKFDKHDTPLHISIEKYLEAAHNHGETQTNDCNTSPAEEPVNNSTIPVSDDAKLPIKSEDDIKNNKTIPQSNEDDPVANSLQPITKVPEVAATLSNTDEIPTTTTSTDGSAVTINEEAASKLKEYIKTVANMDLEKVTEAMKMMYKDKENNLKREPTKPILRNKESVRKEKHYPQTEDSVELKSNGSTEPDSRKMDTSEHHKEFDQIIGDVIEHVKNTANNKVQSEPDPLPEGNFVDVHAPKKRVSIFKASRKN